MDGDLQTEVVLADGQVALAVRGEIDMATARRLERACHRLVAHTDRLILDFTGVTFMDCSGLSALVAVHDGHSDTRITLRNASDRILRLLETARLTELLIDGEPNDRGDELPHVADDVDTFLKVLECFGDPRRTASLLDPTLVVEGCDGSPLDPAALVDQLHLLRNRGASLAVVATELLRDRMLIGWTVDDDPTLPPMNGSKEGTRWRVLSLRDGRIVHILHCLEREQAFAELALAPLAATRL
jgi:anti-anti-sigma factor